MEDICVRYDYTVRNDQNDIIQFYYGEDGMDGVSIEWNTFSTLNLSPDDLHSEFFNENVPEEFQLIVQDQKFLQMIFDNGEESRPMPTNLKRILVKALRIRSGAEESDKIKFNAVQKLREKLSINKPILKRQRRYMGRKGVIVPTLFQILISSVLATKKLVGITRDGLDYLIKTVELKFFTGLIQAGESVGVVAAQSIGEPATQMTLNTVSFILFHYFFFSFIRLVRGIKVLLLVFLDSRN